MKPSKSIFLEQRKFIFHNSRQIFTEKQIIGQWMHTTHHTYIIHWYILSLWYIFLWHHPWYNHMYLWYHPYSYVTNHLWIFIKKSDDKITKPQMNMHVCCISNCINNNAYWRLLPYNHVMLYGSMEPAEHWLKFTMYIFLIYFINWYFGQFLWNQVELKISPTSAMRFHWWQDNISSLPSGTKPLLNPKLT